MRTLIAYSTLTGNTKKVCEAAAKAFYRDRNKRYQ